MFKDRKVVALIPARNEELAIAEVVDDCYSLKNSGDNQIIDRVLVCDNGSIDDTATIAQQHGARVVSQNKAGYGSACLAMIGELKQWQLSPESILIFIDGDASVKVDEAMSLLHHLDARAGLVIGWRIEELRELGSMTGAQLFGNGIASWLIRILFNYVVKDLGPFRVISYADLLQLNMQDQAFGWTVEMQLKALLEGVPTSEVPVTCRRRKGQSKISGNPVGVVKAGIGIIGTIIKLRLLNFGGAQRPTIMVPDKSQSD